MKGRMMTENFERIAQRMGIVAAVAGLLAAGPCVLAARSQQKPQTPGEAKRFATSEEMKEAQREKEEEEREREEEIRDREQEKKDQEQERAERLQELYDDGREALDDGQYCAGGEEICGTVSAERAAGGRGTVLAGVRRKQGRQERSSIGEDCRPQEELPAKPMDKRRGRPGNGSAAKLWAKSKSRCGQRRRSEAAGIAGDHEQQPGARGGFWWRRY